MAKSQSASAIRRGVDRELIREMRLERELTIPAAALLIGCHFKTLDGIERGRWGASEVMLRKIARAYKVRPDEIRARETAA